MTDIDHAAITRSLSATEKLLADFEEASRAVIADASAGSTADAGAGGADLAKEAAKYEKELERYNDQVAALERDLQRSFTEVRQHYTDVVALADGLTSVQPSVVKAFEKFVATLDDRHLDAASKALKKHRDEVLKANKSDKNAKFFAKEMDGLISQCK